MLAEMMAPRPSQPIAGAFYDRYLSEEDRSDFQAALAVDGLDSEIALIRLQLLHLCQDDPRNAKAHAHLISVIERLFRTRKSVFGTQDPGPRGSAGGMLADFDQVSPDPPSPSPDGRRCSWIPTRKFGAARSRRSSFCCMHC